MDARKVSQLKTSLRKRELYHKETGMSHETEGQGSDCIATVSNNRTRGMNAENMHSLHSFSLLLPEHHQHNSDGHCFPLPKAENKAADRFQASLRPMLKTPREGHWLAQHISTVASWTKTCGLGTQHNSELKGCSCHKHVDVGGKHLEKLRKKNSAD